MNARRDDHVRERRVQYETAGLERSDLDASPVQQWHRWYDAAVEADLPEPNAMVLSTIGTDGVPDSRVVLARGVDERGIAFFGTFLALRHGDQPIANLLVSSAMAHGLRQAFPASLSEVRLGTFRPESQD